MRHRLASLFLATLILALLFSTLNISPRLTQAQGAPELPDLIVTDVRLSGSQICYTLKNTGTGSVGSLKEPTIFWNALFIDNTQEPVKIEQVSLYLAPGGQAKEICFNYTWQMTQSQHTLMVCADWGQNKI